MIMFLAFLLVLWAVFTLGKCLGWLIVTLLGLPFTLRVKAK